jgi:hypothetical protein
MKVPEILASAFGQEFESLIAQFAAEQGLIPDIKSLQSPRFLARSVVPHVTRLSSLFNRDQKEQGSALSPYWKQSSNPAHFRLAYFLYFMPSNLFRVASVWSELARLGFQWPHKELDAVEFGAGPASGLCGIAAGAKYSGTSFPQLGRWALIEQDKAVLELGLEWAQTYMSHLGMHDWSARSFHRKLDPKQGFLPRNAPRFNLWLMSYYLNELDISPQELAKTLIQDWARHLEEEGIVILVEPALKLQSRKLLELRRELLKERDKQNADWLQVLLPCLGHQACGALSNPEDWCHEEVTWWRPPYFRTIDKMASLDRKTLPFSYLVLMKTRRSRNEILPALGATTAEQRSRLVSPAHSEGKELEFFICSQEGKRRTRYRPYGDSDVGAGLQRGDILLEPDTRGDRNSSRTSKIKKVI